MSISLFNARKQKPINFVYSIENHYANEFWSLIWLIYCKCKGLCAPSVTINERLLSRGLNFAIFRKYLWSCQVISSRAVTADTGTNVPWVNATHTTYVYPVTLEYVWIPAISLFMNLVLHHGLFSANTTDNLHIHPKKRWKITPALQTHRQTVWWLFELRWMGSSLNIPIYIY